jgi:hypothetical protein
MPLTALILAAVGIYSSRPDPVQGSFAVTVILSAPICAWFVSGVEREVGAAATAILTVRSGGAAAAWRGHLAIVGVFSAAITAVFVALPVIAGAFDRSLRLGDIVAATLSHLASCASGGSLGLVLGPPTRAATAAATIVAVMIASVALGSHVGMVAGPGGVAHQLSVAQNGTLPGLLLTSCGLALLEAAALVYAACAIARWRG